MILLTENAVHQSGPGMEKTWSIPDLLETYNPLPGEALAERNAVLRQAVEMAEEQYADLSEAARLRYDFWKLFLPQRIAEQRFEYTTKVSDTHHWELTINASGLFYKDVSGAYYYPGGAVSEQLFSDFWFYGPLLPIPDLQVRKQLVAAIRNAFLQAGSPASYKHFALFEYPKQPVSPLHWVFGDHNASDFITVRDYGIETGATNWHDGLVYLQYTSFEHFLTLPPREGSLITPSIRAEITQLLTPKIPVTETLDRAALGKNEVSKRLFMSNVGQVHYIYLDGDGPNYSASPAEEAAWRAELIADYTRRLSEEDDPSMLEFLARGLVMNGVKNVEEILKEANKTQLGNDE